MEYGKYEVVDMFGNGLNLNINYDTIVYIEKLEGNFYEDTFLEVANESSVALNIFDEQDLNTFAYLRSRRQQIFVEFLDKFCTKKMQKNRPSFRNPCKVLDCWKIEFGFLMATYQWFIENPNEFEKAIKKAENEKEFKLLLGMR